MSRIRKTIKQLSFKFGIYASISICVLILLLLVSTLFFRGIEALQTQYLSLNNVRTSNLELKQVEQLIHKDFYDKDIKNYNINSFDIKKHRISGGKLLIPIQNQLSDTLLQKLKKSKMIKTEFNLSFFEKKDSTNARKAGILTGFIGSVLTILICILFSVPLGIGSAIYLEEFAPKNKLTTFIEVNIKNLAAIPSVVYGLLGLILFVNIMQIDRSSSLVGGLTLSLMSTPIIMVVTQQALRSIPFNIREGAFAMGASKIQLLFQFQIPISIPTILTGVVLAISRIIGETAPLIIVGMTAFVTQIPQTFLDPTTTLPTQIYLWSDNVDNLFIAKSCLAILLLLFILIIVNYIALYLKSKLSRNVY